MENKKISLSGVSVTVFVKGHLAFFLNSFFSFVWMWWSNLHLFSIISRLNFMIERLVFWYTWIFLCWHLALLNGRWCMSAPSFMSTVNCWMFWLHSLFRVVGAEQTPVSLLLFPSWMWVLLQCASCRSVLFFFAFFLVYGMGSSHLFLSLCILFLHSSFQSLVSVVFLTSNGIILDLIFFQLVKK